LCSHKLDKKLDKNEDPNDEEREEMKSRWAISDKYFALPPYRQEESVIEEFTGASPSSTD
jgi:hypothetical protein